VDALAVDVEPAAYAGQQEDADVGRGTEVNEVEQAVLVESSHDDAQRLLNARCMVHIQTGVGKCTTSALTPGRMVSSK